MLSSASVAARFSSASRMSLSSRLEVVKARTYWMLLSPWMTRDDDFNHATTSDSTEWLKKAAYWSMLFVCDSVVCVSNERIECAWCVWIRSIVAMAHQPQLTVLRFRCDNRMCLINGDNSLVSFTFSAKSSHFLSYTPKHIEFYYFQFEIAVDFDFMLIWIEYPQSTKKLYGFHRRKLFAERKQRNRKKKRNSVLVCHTRENHWFTWALWFSWTFWR